MTWWQFFDQPWTKEIGSVLVVAGVLTVVLLVLGFALAIVYQRWKEGKKDLS